MKPWKLLEIKQGDALRNPCNVAVLPLGATEPHNLHLPYGTDNLETEMIGDRICEKAYNLGARVLLLPCIPFGVNSNLMKFPMTISIRPSTLDRIIWDIVKSLEHHNIQKIVLLNGHGGNSLKHTLREFYGRTKAFLSLVDWYSVAKDLYPQIFKEAGDHAGEMETSLGLYLFPELTDVSLADDGVIKSSRFKAINKGWVQVTRPFDLISTHCGIGNPAKATAEKGRILVDVIAERIGNYIKELSDADMDHAFPF
ncbi:MAG: creatininase family protein [Candidatus Omnitrophota bacterium]|jgi:creatinine amidohydrolase|nr:MAG: creatininase family protein [Candidatus Omnitrophota bacterium]